jgi:hypothetical protein
MLMPRRTTSVNVALLWRARERARAVSADVVVAEAKARERRVVVQGRRERLRALSADVVVLEHQSRERRVVVEGSRKRPHADWPIRFLCSHSSISVVFVARTAPRLPLRRHRSVSCRTGTAGQARAAIGGSSDSGLSIYAARLASAQARPLGSMTHSCRAWLRGLNCIDLMGWLGAGSIRAHY